MLRCEIDGLLARQVILIRKLCWRIEKQRCHLSVSPSRTIREIPQAEGILSLEQLPANQDQQQNVQTGKDGVEFQPALIARTVKLFELI